MIQGKEFSAYGKSELEALNNLAEKLEQSTMPLGSLPFVRWLEDRYLPSIQHTSKAHKQKAKWAIQKVSRLHNVPLESLDRQKLQAMFTTLAKDLKPGTLKTLRSVIVAALNLAEADDVISKNPMRYVKLPRLIPVKKPVLDASQMLTLIEHSRGYASHPVVILEGLMGLRIGEIARLRPEHFKEPGKLIVPGTKTASSLRELPLHPKILEELGSYTFPLTRIGSPARNALSAAAFRAQLPHVHSHLLRHSFSSLLEWLGCPHDVRARLLGHGKRSTTEGYSHSAWNQWKFWLDTLVTHVYENDLGKKVGGSNLQ